MVPLEDFFDGNDVRGTIGANVEPDPRVVGRALSRLQADERVQCVMIRIVDIEGDWPLSDTAYVISSLSEEEIRAYLEDVPPDEVFDGWGDKTPSAVPDVNEGMKVTGVWWGLRG